MNDHVAEPFRSILARKPPTNRDRFDVLSVVHAKLEEAGVVLDIGQLDWACREVEQALYERSLDRQFKSEQLERSK